MLLHERTNIKPGTFSVGLKANGANGLNEFREAGQQYTTIAPV
jgi:hypothetical protein